MKVKPFTIIVALFIITMIDHSMRLDQKNLCLKNDSIECPAKMWWFG